MEYTVHYCKDFGFGTGGRLTLFLQRYWRFWGTFDGCGQWVFGLHCTEFHEGVLTRILKVLGVN